MLIRVDVLTIVIIGHLIVIGASIHIAVLIRFNFAIPVSIYLRSVSQLFHGHTVVRLYLPVACNFVFGHCSLLDIFRW